MTTETKAETAGRRRGRASWIFLKRARIVALSALAFAAPVVLPASVAVVPTPARAQTTGVPAVVQAWAAAWNDADAVRMADLFKPDGIYEDLGFQVKFQGRDGVAEWVKITGEAISDTTVEVVEAFQAGDRIAVQWIFKGTPVRFGSASTNGKSFSVPAVSIFVLQGEQIRQVTDYYNLADLFRQVGLPSDAWTPPAAADPQD